MSLAGLLTKWNTRVGDVTSVAFPLAFALTTYEVGARYFFGRPTIWTLEVALLASGIAYILTGPQATALDSHIRMDVITRLLPASIKRWTAVMSDVFTTAFGLIVVYTGIRLALPLAEGIERTGSAFNSPAPTVIKLLIPVAGLLIALQALIRVPASFKGRPDEIPGRPPHVD